MTFFMTSNITARQRQGKGGKGNSGNSLTAPRPIHKSRVIRLRDSSRDPLSKSVLLVVILREISTRVPVRQQDGLRVAVPVDVELDAVQVPQLLRVGSEGCCLGGVVRREPAEGLGARVRRGPVAAPAHEPVPVDICADCCRVSARLSVLAPEAVRCLCVYEAFLLSVS